MLQTQVGVCEQHKNSRQTRFYLTPTVCKRVCHLFLCCSHTPTWVCQCCLRPTQSCMVLPCIYMRPAELVEFLNGMEVCKYGTFFFQVPDLHTKPFKSFSGSTSQVFVYAKICRDPCKWGLSVN